MEAIGNPSGHAPSEARLMAGSHSCAMYPLASFGPTGAGVKCRCSSSLACRSARSTQLAQLHLDVDLSR